MFDLRSDRKHKINTIIKITLFALIFTKID